MLAREDLPLTQDKAPPKTVALVKVQAEVAKALAAAAFEQEIKQ